MDLCHMQLHTRSEPAIDRLLSQSIVMNDKDFEIIVVGAGELISSAIRTLSKGQQDFRASS
jgi:hypothetical protein